MDFSLSQIATDLISGLGYLGLAFGLVIDSFGIPVPSEILVPLATILAFQGRFELWAVFVVATVAQVVGSSIAYAIGRYGGEPLLERYGKYVLISQHDLQRVHRVFEKYGIWVTLVGRCVPGIRGLVAYPAGVAEMPWRTFLLFTVVGSAVWTAFLMVLGYWLGGNLELMDQLAHQFSVVGIVLVLGFLVWHFRHIWMQKR
jgi:membrane protein DedA with SNARE-associated domain